MLTWSSYYILMSHSLPRSCHTAHYNSVTWSSYYMLMSHSLPRSCHTANYNSVTWSSYYILMSHSLPRSCHTAHYNSVHQIEFSIETLKIVSREPTQFLILHFRAAEVEFATFLRNGCTALFCRVRFCKVPYNYRLMSCREN